MHLNKEVNENERKFRILRQKGIFHEQKKS
jgi:hypothetical protein